MTNRTHIAAAFALSLGALFADADANGFNERKAAFEKIAKETVDFDVVNKSLAAEDVLYGKTNDGKVDKKSYAVCYTKDHKSGFVVKAHPNADLVGKKVKEIDYKALGFSYSAKAVEKVIKMFYKTDLNKETAEYKLGSKKTAFIVYKEGNDLCALINDKG
ncbi:MAG: hypothetical protein CNLJKLNK_00103 [Holosporales bacterium]